MNFVCFKNILSSTKFLSFSCISFMLEDSDLVDCDAVLLGKWFPLFWRSLAHSSLRFKLPLLFVLLNPWRWRQHLHSDTVWHSGWFGFSVLCEISYCSHLFMNSSVLSLKSVCLFSWNMQFKWQFKWREFNRWGRLQNGRTGAEAVASISPASRNVVQWLRGGMIKCGTMTQGRYDQMWYNDSGEVWSK